MASSLEEDWGEAKPIGNSHLEATYLYKISKLKRKFPHNPDNSKGELSGVIGNTIERPTVVAALSPARIQTDSIQNSLQHPARGWRIFFTTSARDQITSLYTTA